MAQFSEGLWGKASMPLRGSEPSSTALDLDAMTVSSPCRLPPVHVARDRVLRTVVGLRPFRPSGFVVRTEKLDDTLVVHNYGHGGAGVSLSWGTAQLALQAACQDSQNPAAVLGCGAVGLATARLLQEAGFKVTIYANNVPPETTSNAAGGAWMPFLVADPEKADQQFNRQLLLAAKYSYDRYTKMIGGRWGVRWMKSYSISRSGFDEAGPAGRDNMFRSMRQGFRDLKPSEHPFDTNCAVRQVDTLLIEPPIYLQSMMDEFLEASGQIVRTLLSDRAAIVHLPQKLVFNCTGLGAKQLFNDSELVPARGQLTFLQPQPEVQYAVSHDELYMLPRSEGIALGGTYELGNTSLIPSSDSMRRILARHKAFFDSYRHAVC
jgi:D-amino-acid oxidase